LVDQAHGDARALLNMLESAADLAARRETRRLTVALIEEAAQRRAPRYDKRGEEHYNVVSAFIKSMRGSDPDAAVYWLMRMLEAGEDPLFVARRMVIFAAEDVGLADPRALSVAVAAKDAFAFVGLPEGRIPLAEAAVYLALAPKSNSAYRAMLGAAADVAARGALPIPLQLRNAPTELMRDLDYGKGYQYAHDQPHQEVTHAHLPDDLRDRQYYSPTENGEEKSMASRLVERRRRSRHDRGGGRS
jgi:putative ATPase